MMKRKNKTCYCEIDFLKEFINSHPTMLLPDDSIIRYMDNWLSLYKFICKSDVVINISSAEFQRLAETDDWFRMFWKKSGNGDCNIEFVDKLSFPFIKDLSISKCDERHLNAVFLTTQPDQICIQQSKKYGVIVLNNNLLRECDHLYMDSGTEFPSDRAKDWSFMQGLNRVFPTINTCNSMIIVDNYLFSDDIKNGFDERLEYNLKPLLKSLLPEKLAESECFEISIFTEDQNKQGLDRQLNYLNSLLYKIRPNLNFRLSIYGECRGIFHDRGILTNNVWISSGHGFDIVKKDKTLEKPTTINIAFPFLQNKLSWCDGTVLNVVLKAASISENRLVEKDNYWGDEKRSNRIIYFFNHQEKEIKNEDIKDVKLINNKPIVKIDLTKIPGYSEWGKKF